MSIVLYHHHAVKGRNHLDARLIVCHSKFPHMIAPGFTVREVRLYERDVRLRCRSGSA
jgi:hypothetical protein